MNRLKCLFITIKSQLDGLADDFENHEAVAGVAIKDLEAWRTHTRIHQHRLQKMMAQLATNHEELTAEAATWSARALKVRVSDQLKALECVRRMRRAQQQAQLLATQLQTAQQQQAQLAADLNTIHSQLQHLNTQKTVFAARQSRIQLQGGLANKRDNPLDEAQKIFDRWEEAIGGAELTAIPDAYPVDPLADSFAQEEETLALQQLLDELAAAANPEQENDHVRQ